MVMGLVRRCLRRPVRVCRRMLRGRFDPNAEGRLDCQRLFGGKIGLEIGGPSGIFRGGDFFPVYPAAARVDNCNFSDQTVWSGTVPEGMHFRYDDAHAPGRQFIREATNLNGIASRSYDFVLASHCLEHVANPLRAMREWLRVLKDRGVLVLIVPHADGTFDHNRPTTSLSHLIADEQNAVGEDDLSHLPEILALHDLAMDAPAGDIENFTRRSEKNIENRCLHHHVFDTRLAIELANHVGLKIRSVWIDSPFHIFVVGEKRKTIWGRKNTKFLGPHVVHNLKISFPRDCPDHAGARR